MKTGHRAMVLGASVLAHAVALIWLSRADNTPPRQLETTHFSVSLIDGRDPTSSMAERPTEPIPATASAKAGKTQVTRLEHLAAGFLPPVDVSQEPTPFTEDATAASVVEAASLAAGQECELGSWLQGALQDSQDVRSALGEIPRPARSVANALMLWNGAWVETPNAERGLSVIRAAVMSGIRAAPAPCRDEIVHGPVLLTLLDPTGSTLLAVGSGEWRWDDLLAEKA
ncbi:MAG: hypothetical protein PSX79_06270, partial [bacterium]|nr:hypothetical protein [bacterium]